MTDERDDVLEDLRAELSAISPSPGFAASVRTRVAASSDRRGLGTWMWPVALAAAAVIVVSAYVAFTTTPIEETPVPQMAGTAAPAAAPVRSEVTAAVPAAGAAPVASAPKLSPASRQSSDVHAVATGPALDVITNQPEVLRAIWARARWPMVEATVETASPVPAEVVREISVAPILVEPIVVRALDPSGTGGGGTPEIRRVAADATGSER